MRFLIDAQLPPSLAVLLREHGHDADHVYNVMPADARDATIWPFGIQAGYVLVTKDEDFAEWSRLLQPAPPILWLRVGNLKKSQLAAKFMPLLPELIARLNAGETLIEIF